MRTSKPRIIVTCGPSFEPIDSVRCITNSSTGELGVLLSEEMTAHGVEVICLKGRLATFRDPSGASLLTYFDTNSSLLRILEQQSMDARHRIDAVYHAAALCDYRVAHVRNVEGEVVSAAKVPTDCGNLTLQLEPTIKLLPHIRMLFPKAWIVGWKLEHMGNPETTVQKALQQLQIAQSDECIINGPAFGVGFGLCNPRGLVSAWDSKVELCRALTERLLKNTNRSSAC